MNKQELLNDLSSKNWCDSLNGPPELQEVKVDGGRWYNQNTREVQSESVCVYRNIPFYVVDEGKPTEKAYYKDAVPETITKKILTFTEKVREYTVENPYCILEEIDEEVKFAIIKRYIVVDTAMTERRFFLQEVNEIIDVKEII
jgi:hypothetical protein